MPEFPRLRATPGRALPVRIKRKPTPDRVCPRYPPLRTKQQLKGSRTTNHGFGPETSVTVRLASSASRSTKNRSRRKVDLELGRSRA
ncbi:hypothetical protein ZHAS_00011140 [Anopheles sinensis]|uniref:Uncharacterized protein n=1 Tax=Anopheles sinensis TaxID=74873 RepID=A0A084VZF2_ANOSI|nr:hypothetical protein ZHAS_00011140 [Anopheles sinensis]